MDIERAIEILDPEHREHYDSIETVNEACRMGRDALRQQLAAQGGDYISKELAIAALHDKIVKNRIYCPEDDGLDEFETEEVLRKLPSVSLRPIVWPVRWIPVEEQMPEMHDAGILKMLGIQQMSEKVLLAILNEEEAIVDNDAELRDGEWHSDTLRLLKAGGKAFTVTHWMPLPEPPNCGADMKKD